MEMYIIMELVEKPDSSIRLLILIVGSTGIFDTTISMGEPWRAREGLIYVTMMLTKGSQYHVGR